MSEVAIDPATVQRCIEVLRGKGEYKFHGYGLVGKPRESWTYTTHPIDILQALIPEPEKSEAEKLVDEWQELQPADSYDSHDTNDHVSLVQFVLDKTSEEYVKAMMLASVKPKLDVCATTDSQPKYVFGPWIEWHGGKCPVPDDWMVETVYRYESLEHHKTTITHAGWFNSSLFENQGWEHKGAGVMGNTYDITHYRVRFEVGKWYGWAGGPCPVLPEQLVDVVCADGYKTRSVAHRFGKSDSHAHNWWTGECLKGGGRNDQITSFRCVE